MNKGVLIGNFITKNKILSFLEAIHNLFRIDLSKVFIYEIDTNYKEYLVTFKVNNRDEFKDKIPNSIVMHTKNGCLFSINALNKLIDQEKTDTNLDNKDIIIDWEKYRGKLITVSNRQLCISQINKIEDKSIFFK